MLHNNVFTYCKVSGFGHFLYIRSLHGQPFAGRASNWQSNKLGCYITMSSPNARSVVLRRRNQTIIDLLGNVFIHNAARPRLSPQMAKPCKERINSLRGGFKGWGCWAAVQCNWTACHYNNRSSLQPQRNRWICQSTSDRVLKPSLIMTGCSIWNPYSPCGRFTPSLPQGECDFQMDWHIEQHFLKFTPPLCNIVVQSLQRVNTSHVEVSRGLFHLKLIHPLWTFHKESVNFQCISQFTVFFFLPFFLLGLLPLGHSHRGTQALWTPLSLLLHVV